MSNHQFNVGRVSGSVTRQGLEAPVVEDVGLRYANPTYAVDWQTKTLNDVCIKITDGAHNSPKSVMIGKPMACVKDLTRFGVDLSQARLIANEDFEALVKQGCKPEIGDVLIAKDGNSALDTVCTVKKPLEVVVLSSVAILRPDPSQLSSDYLKYYFSSTDVIDYLKSNFISGAAIPRVVLRDFKKAEIVIPPLEVQDKIASTLNSFDDRIALLRETNTTLEAIAQALFKSWFVDFDPVHANADLLPSPSGRGAGGEGNYSSSPHPSPLPEGEGVVLPPEIAALFSDSFEASELGLVPKGWLVAPIGNVVEIVGGGTPNTKEPEYWEPGEFSWTTPKDLSGLQSPVLLKTERLLSAKGVSKVSSGLLPIGTLLLSSRAPIGYLAIAQIPLAINQGYIAILPSSQLQPLYMYFWLKQNMDVIKSRSNGSTFMEISKKAFRPIPMLVPVAGVLDKFLDIVNPIFTRLTENEKQAQNLTTLRDTLLPRLISGQLRLPGAEALTQSHS